MTSTLRVAVFGCGRIGQMHAELLARRVPGATVAVVYDAFADASRAVGARLGVPVAHSVDEVLGNADVDAVAICSSTDTHVQLMIAAAEAGKAIFCEKPISLALDQVDRGLAAVGAASVPLMIGFNRRFDASHRAVRDAVASGAVGAVHIVRITSRDPAPPPIAYIQTSGGIFLDMTIHDFDMARYVTGSEIVAVTAKGAVRVDPAIGAAGDLDTVVIVLEHADGAITTIDNSRQAVYGYDQRVEVFGSKGMASSENPLTTTTVVRDASGSHHATLPYFFLDRYIPSYLAEWEAFVATAHGTPSPVSGADGRAPLVAGLAALRSVREGRTVTTSEITADLSGAVSVHHFPAGSLVSGDDPLHLTPERAGWAYCGLHVVHLRAGEARCLATDDAEMIVLPLSATRLRVVVDGEELRLDGRTSVFARVTDFAYAGRDSVVDLTSEDGGEIALASARCARRLPPKYGTVDAVAVETRGAGPATRQVTNFASPDTWAHADRLMCVELLTPDGNWSSYPPHRHDDSPECPVNNEEIYYFRIGRAGTTEYAADGFGLHRTYTPDGAVDDNVVVHDGDVYVVPRGYHGPCVAAPGYTMYYLNVLAGPAGERSMAFCDDPTHHWVRDAWRDQTTDPRCPMTDRHGPVTSAAR